MSDVEPSDVGGTHTRLDPNVLLGREFDYAAQAAIEAGEDRVRVFTFFLAAIGSLVATTKLADPGNPAQQVAFGAVLAAIALLGSLCVFQLAKLRLAWVDSVRTMCAIKEYYVAASDDPRLATAIRWTSRTVPRADKLGSVSFLLAVAASFVGGACLGGAVFLWVGAASGPTALRVALGGAAGSVSIAMQIYGWFAICRH